LDEIRLDRTEQRVIGVLIEKAFTVPDAYPLTFNALVAGCSQKSNRDPVLDLPEHHVDGALKALFIRGWVERRSREGGRVMRWGHRVPEKLGLEGERQAVLAELLLRGAQTLGELRTRASRMTPLATTDEVREILGALAERGFVAELPRRPGERGQRWTHLLGTEPEEVLPRPATAIEPPEAPPPAPPPAPTPGVLPTPEPAASEADRLTALEEEVRLLREEVESLRRAMTELP
jgi:uncharacterized protein YceH (UPF0502 family)